jgi:prevent-host-death family protein
MPTTVNASTFKATCLALLDDVAESGTEIIVTKRGKPIARLVAIAPPESLIGSVTQHVDDDALVARLDSSWDAEQG